MRTTDSMSIVGRLVRVSDENPNLVSFVSLRADQKACSNALVLIAGLTDGFMALAYTEALSRALLEIDYSLVMVNLSSSWSQFGFKSLASDCEELEKHVSSLKTRFELRNIVLLGHSTGAQDALYFMRHGTPAVTSLISGIILQGAVSDRDAMTMEPQFSQMMEEAMKLESEKKTEAILSQRFYGAPITANRLLSLAGKLTDDDMFSTDLTVEELDPVLSCIDRIPIQLCFSENDEYVPDHPAQKELAQRMIRVLEKYSNCVEWKYYVGNHGLSEPQFYEPFVKDVVKFTASL